MCTVKKDITMPEPAITLDASATTVPTAKPTSATDYDIINRQQSQLLLDMIYSSSKNQKKNACFYSSKIPCPGTAAAAAVGATSDKAVLDEIQKIKHTISDLQTQITKLPQQIVAAFLEAQVCHKLRAQMDEEEDDFDKLSSVSEVSSDVVLPRSSSQQHPQCNQHMSTRTSMSSDIEVLNYHCFSRSSCSGTSQPAASSMSSSRAASLPVIDISKEITQLSKALNSIVLPNDSSMSTPTSEATEPWPKASASSEMAKQIASSIFSHWEQRYVTSKAESDKSHSTAPIGNIRCHQQASKAASSYNLSTSAIPKILPYNSAIDLNVWLK